MEHNLLADKIFYLSQCHLILHTLLSLDHNPRQFLHTKTKHTHTFSGIRYHTYQLMTIYLDLNRSLEELNHHKYGLSLQVSLKLVAMDMSRYNLKDPFFQKKLSLMYQLRLLYCLILNIFCVR